ERDGPVSVTQRKVATEAGVPPSAVTYYYATVDDLLVDTLVRVNDNYVAQISALPPGDEAIAALARIIAPSDATDRAHLMAECELFLMAARRPSMRDELLRWSRTLDTFLTRYITDPDRRLAASAAIDGLFLRCCAPEGPFSPTDEEIHRVLVRLLHAQDVPGSTTHTASVPRLLSGSAHSFPGAFQLTAPLRQRPLREGVAGHPVPQVLGKTHHDRVLHLGGCRAHVVVVDDTEDQPTPVRCGHMAGQGTDPGHRAGLGLHDTLGRGTDHATRERAPDERVRVTRHRQGHPELLRPRGVTGLHQQIGDGARGDPVAPGKPRTIVEDQIIGVDTQLGEGFLDPGQPRFPTALVGDLLPDALDQDLRVRVVAELHERHHDLGQLG